MWSFRRPSPVMRLLKWHRAYLRGDNPPRHEGEPQCGWYRTRMVKNGPWVPVEIWCEQITDDDSGELVEPERLQATAYDQPIDPAKHWPFLEPISRKEFMDLLTWRENQHHLTNETAINLAEAPTLPNPRGRT